MDTIFVLNEETNIINIRKKKEKKKGMLSDGVDLSLFKLPLPCALQNKDFKMIV